MQGLNVSTNPSCSIKIRVIIFYISRYETTLIRKGNSLQKEMFGMTSDPRAPLTL